jgi:hypothetical protein
MIKWPINFEEKVNNDLYLQNSSFFQGVDEKEYAAAHRCGWLISRT